MAQDIPGTSIQATRNADNTMTYLVMRPNGGIVCAFTLAAADQTAINALTSGNSLTVSYGENAMPNIPYGYAPKD